MNIQILTTMVQTLSSFTSDEILALGNAVGLWGDIAKTNMAYEKAVQYKICDASGTIHQPIELMAAVDHILDNAELKVTEKRIKMKDEFIYDNKGFHRSTVESTNTYLNLFPITKPSDSIKKT